MQRASLCHHARRFPHLCSLPPRHPPVSFRLHLQCFPHSTLLLRLKWQHRQHFSCAAMTTSPLAMMAARSAAVVASAAGAGAGAGCTVGGVECHFHFQIHFLLYLVSAKLELETREAICTELENAALCTAASVRRHSQTRPRGRRGQSKRQRRRRARLPGPNPNKYISVCLCLRLRTIVELRWKRALHGVIEVRGIALVARCFSRDAGQ